MSTTVVEVVLSVLILGFFTCIILAAQSMGAFCPLTGHDWVRTYDESFRECIRCGVRE